MTAPKKYLEARADGCFRHTEDHLVAALLKVEPCVRGSHLGQIEWQEGAQRATNVYKLLYLVSHPPREFGLLRVIKLE